ncbi:MAG: hypothetical protein KIT31_07160 [Deltaproteobacteria bacterium]|nr:hypothetical protein [Deltaproteobacteria bacterium]
MPKVISRSVVVTDHDPDRPVVGSDAVVLHVYHCVCGQLALILGKGEAGGRGCGGGGGCGGSSFGIFTSGVGSPNYCQAGAANVITGGGGGAGGSGGFSVVNNGTSGATGSLTGCVFQ